MTHRGPFQPLLFCDSVTSVPVALRSVAFLDKPRLLLHIWALYEARRCFSQHNGMAKGASLAAAGAQHAFTCTKSAWPVLLACELHVCQTSRGKLRAAGRVCCGQCCSLELDGAWRRLTDAGQRLPLACSWR